MCISLPQLSREAKQEYKHEGYKEAEKEKWTKRNMPNKKVSGTT